MHATHIMLCTSQITPSEAMEPDVALADVVVVVLERCFRAGECLERVFSGLERVFPSWRGCFRTGDGLERVFSSWRGSGEGVFRAGEGVSELESVWRGCFRAGERVFSCVEYAFFLSMRIK